MNFAWRKSKNMTSQKSYENQLQETDIMFKFKNYLTEILSSLPGKKHRVRILSLEGI
jgi:hypothetical protein